MLYGVAYTGVRFVVKEGVNADVLFYEKFCSAIFKTKAEALAYCNSLNSLID